MIQRYPHTVLITLKRALTGADDGIVGTDNSAESKYSIQGRLEFANENGTSYKARFFTRSNEYLRHLGNAESFIEWEGRRYNILRIIPLQTSIEIWVE